MPSSRRREPWPSPSSRTGSRKRPIARTNELRRRQREAEAQEPIDGLRVHTAGFTGNGFRIFEVWDSKEQFDRFLADRLMPLLVEQEGDPTPPTMTVYELHNYVVA